MRENKLTISLITVGEEITLQTLERLKKYATREYDLLVWYHPFVFDENFFKSLGSFTHNVIFCTKNQGTMSLMLYSMLCIPSDYILGITADTLVNENYMETLFAPFEELEDVAVTGESFRDFPEKYIVNNPDNRPDNLELYSKDAINIIGAYTPAFARYGHHNTEWHMRAMQRGWKVVSVKGTATHNINIHAGRDQMPNWQEELDKSCRVQKQMEQLGFKGYNWWSDRI